MKEELVKLAYEKNFTSLYAKISVEAFAQDSIQYYLWLCELNKWIRDKYNLHLYIVPYGDGKTWRCANIRYNGKEYNEVDKPFMDKVRKFEESYKYDSYEGALQFGLKEALTLINL